MDNLNQKIKHLVQKGKEKGYLTYEELNDMLPDDADISPEKIDDILMMLDELGIDLIDETEIESRDVADAEEAPVFTEVDLEFGEVPTITEKIDDPVRMYLTQMGEIPLLTRDEEIMLAKKIEITRKRFLKKVLHSDLSLSTCLKILEDVNNGELSFDRTLKVNAMVDNCKDEILEQFPRSSKILKTILQKNKDDYLRAKRKQTSEKERIKLERIRKAEEEKRKGEEEKQLKLKKKLEDKGLIFSGEWPETGLMEIVELKNHPFMLGSQFHPEFKSRPHRPHPLFAAFMGAAVGN